MKKKITELLNGVGVRNVGFCKFEWISERLISCRALSRIPEKAETVICCAFPYKVREMPPENISRYAAVPDYHRIVLPLLENAANELKKEFPEYKFVPFCDNSPIPEVRAASSAGLGVRGENGLLITEKYGSFVFLAEIVTDATVECENLYKECLKCGLCKKHCPKMSHPCLSLVTQKKGELSLSEQAALRENGLVWGCDICAEVCPLNKSAELTYIKPFSDGYRNSFSEGEDITGRAYEWRGEAPVRRNLKIVGTPPEG